MAIAVLSDVHGNTAALRAVLADVDRREVDAVVNLGDVASGGVDPRGTLDLLRSRPGITTVRGNHERQLLELDEQQMTASDRLALGVLDAEDEVWLSELSSLAHPHPDVLACHGTPRDDLQYLLHTLTADGLRAATDDEVVARVYPEAEGHAVLLCGHTHLQGSRRLADGLLVVNPGSVGWPAYADEHPWPHVVEAGSSHARYGVVRRDETGEWTLEHHAVDYDVEESASLAEVNGRPDVAAALRTGRLDRSRPARIVP